MSETKHTPGPWRLHAGSIISPEFDDLPDGYCIAVIEDDGGYEAPFEQRTANARLIAAAPEMLEYLHHALHYVDHEEHPFAKRIAQSIREIIAKA